MTPGVKLLELRLLATDPWRHLAAVSKALNLQKCLGSMCIFAFVSRVSPVGVLFLIAAKLLEMDSFDVIVGQLGMYFMTVLVGIFFHGFVVLPIIFVVFTRTLPFKFIGNMAQALATAFSTASR